MSSEKKALKKEEKQQKKAMTCKFLEWDSYLHPTLCNRKIEFKFRLMCSSANVSELADYVDVSCSRCRKCGYAKLKDNDTETALDEELQKMWILRKVLNPMEDIEITELILDRMKKSKTNEAFLASMNAGTAGME